MKRARARPSSVSIRSPRYVSPRYVSPRYVSPRYVAGRDGVLVLVLTLLLFVGALGSCSTTPSALQPDAAPVAVVPQRDWSDAILYFVLIDRFADGDATNNAHVDKRNPGAYHGGDLQGLIQQLDEIAAHLGIKRDTVYKWISEKSMPAHRMGRLWKFQRTEVDAWVTSGGAEEPFNSKGNRRGV